MQWKNVKKCVLDTRVIWLGKSREEQEIMSEMDERRKCKNGNNEEEGRTTED